MPGGVVRDVVASDGPKRGRSLREGWRGMRVRKNVRSLTADEKKTFVAALLELKKRGTYDHFVHWHHHVMIPAVLPHEPRDANYRNGAHRGPSFLPWHREFLMQVEDALRAVDASVTIPYWDWTQDAALAEPQAASLWSDDFLGGNGAEDDEWRVQTGAFAHKNGNWPVPSYAEDGWPGPGLKRRFATTLPTLPTADDLKLAMREALYDTPHYDKSPFTVGFRNRLEGWVTQRGDPAVKTPGSQLHNRVHLWVGGNMEPMTSPNDPVFFLHHCFVDKVWADWQKLQRENNPEGAPHYAPEQGGPPGHNLDDVLNPWTRKIRDVLDVEALGYTYEQGSQHIEMFKKLDVERRAARRSPFWAD